jgi:basic membrane protein A and related proteins
MKKHQVLSLVLAVVTAMTLVVGCGGTPAAQPTAGAKKLRVAMVFPGSISDKGFNQGGYDGLVMVRDKLGAEIKFSENTPVANYVQVYRDFADQGFDVVIGHGTEFGDIALKVAPSYPKVKFIVDSNPDVHAANVSGIMGKSWESAYLCGVLAGYMTKTGKIGGVVGFDFPVLVAQMEAYKAGARSVRPDIKGTIVYMGSFEDVAKAKEATLAQASAGVDVVFHIADAAAVGVMQAAVEKNIMVIGWGLDQNAMAPKNVIASMISDNGSLIYQDVKQVIDGTWKGEETLFGLESGIVGMSDYHGLVSADIAAKVDQVKKDIISGKVKVTYTTVATPN